MRIHSDEIKIKLKTFDSGKMYAQLCCDVTSIRTTLEKKSSNNVESYPFEIRDSDEEDGLNFIIRVSLHDAIEISPIAECAKERKRNTYFSSF
jgi:hypothetical protein